MKKIFLLATIACLFTGVSFAHDGGGKKCAKGGKDCCKKDTKKEDKKTAKLPAKVATKTSDKS
jgi:hypothetical protein